MQIRCPHNNCPIEVPDDYAGARIRCPHCGNLLIVESTQSDTQSQPSQPEKLKLENQIYDGLPPLAVMIALRRQQSGLDDTQQIPMTEDDWKALSAFERVVDSVSLLRTTLMLGMMALLVNVIVWLAWLPESSKRPLLVQLMPITLAVLCVCFIAIFFGNRTLLRIQRNAPALLLPWLALAVAIVAGGITIMNVQAILDLSASWPFALWYLAAVPLNGFVALHSSRSMWCVSQSLEGISPPEISHRLIEALRYLA